MSFCMNIDYIFANFTRLDFYIDILEHSLFKVQTVFKIIRRTCYDVLIGFMFFTSYT